MKKKNMIKGVLFSLSAAAVLIGCGGSSAVSSGTSISGTVSGSFYEDATVCLDANANGICESDETNTTSAADGSFTLTGNSSYDVVAFIPTGALKHTSIGDAGAAVTNPVTFIAPRAGTASDGSLIVSAISTKVWSAMKENNETLDQAKESVAASLGGVNAADLLEDFNGNTLTAVKKAALQAKANAETVNIEASMVGGVLQLTTLKTKMVEDVISRALATLQATNPVSGLTIPSQVDAIDANASN